MTQTAERSREVARQIVDDLAARPDAPPRSRSDFWQAVYFAARDAYEAGASEGQA